MIQAVTENTDFAGAIRAFSALDPFACRILSLYQSYRPELVFVDYCRRCSPQRLEFYIISD